MTIEIFDRAKRSVVVIATSERVRELWSRNIYSVPRGTGSGFLWDEQGHVITPEYEYTDRAQGSGRMLLSDEEFADLGMTLVESAQENAPR